MSAELPIGENAYLRNHLPDELPAIRDMSSDFDYLLEGFGNNKYRSGLALEYVNHLKARFQPGEYSVGDPEYAREQILPRLFLDTMTFTASREIYQTSARGRGGESTLPVLQGLINAKIDLQKDISEYVFLNPNKDNLVLYHSLVLIMNHSRRVLYGDMVTDERAKQSNLSQLSGILAEYKVLSTLLEDWPQATFGSASQDMAEADIVVPARRNPELGVVLQVKADRNPLCKMKLFVKGRRVPTLVVPMDTSQHDPLKLSGEHSEMVKNYVSAVPRLELAPAT